MLLLQDKPDADLFRIVGYFVFRIPGSSDDKGDFEILD
jgi:hypothetical protein